MSPSLFQNGGTEPVQVYGRSRGPRRPPRRARRARGAARGPAAVHGAVLYCTVPYCTVPYFTVLYCTGAGGRRDLPHQEREGDRGEPALSPHPTQGQTMGPQFYIDIVLNTQYLFGLASFSC